jgi:hypothetical protein
MRGMILWILTYFCLFLGLSELRPLVFRLRIYFSENRAITALREAVYHLKLLQEMLETGNVPEREAWDKIETFPKPWDQIVSASIRDLRAEGAPILPTLSRIQKTLEEQVEFILEARTKSSQAFGQAFLGLVLVPVFGLALFLMLPGIQESARSFFLLTLFSLLLSASAFVWMIAMVEHARFGNLKSENRRWLITVNATLERVLALISTGTPPDLAWKKSMEELSRFDESLVAVWKLQVWDPDFKIPVSVVNESERLILGLGLEVRKSIQTSLLEGRPCLDRIESVHRAFQVDLRALISRELNLLPNRCLKPLFIFVLPAIMILMGGSFAISFQQYFG